MYSFFFPEVFDKPAARELKPPEEAAGCSLVHTQNATNQSPMEEQSTAHGGDLGMLLRGYPSAVQRQYSPSSVDSRTTVTYERLQGFLPDNSTEHQAPLQVIRFKPSSAGAGGMANSLALVTRATIASLVDENSMRMTASSDC